MVAARRVAPCAMDHYQQITEDLRGPYRALRAAIPDVMTAYSGLSGAAMAEGVLSSKTKELIALAVSITRECDGCIVAHARGAARRGATTAEVAEAIGVAISLNGGPATVWGPRALAAFQEFSAAAEADAGA
jgi:AhpD family alkylhydroperoxidase